MFQFLKRFGTSSRSRQSSAARRLSFRPLLEDLEDRQLLTGTPYAAVYDMTQWAQLTVSPPSSQPTTLYLNFEGNNANISPFQPQPGQDRDTAIQDIIYRTSELFAPFNVGVQRMTVANSYPISGGLTTVFIGGDTNNISTSSTGLATKYTYSSTPWDYIDYASQYRGVIRGFNSDLYDLSFIDPMQTFRPLSPAAAGNSANWTNVESDAQIAQGIAHEVGHSYGLAHVTSSPTQDMMSYDASETYFANQTFSITDQNSTGTKTVTDPYHTRPYSYYYPRNWWGGGELQRAPGSTDPDAEFVHLSGSGPG
jgi:hypothetical protein